VGTRGAWAATWGLGTPLALTWRLDPTSVVATPLRTRGA